MGHMMGIMPLSPTLQVICEDKPTLATLILIYLTHLPLHTTVPRPPFLTCNNDDSSNATMMALAPTLSSPTLPHTRQQHCQATHSSGSPSPLTYPPSGSTHIDNMLWCSLYALALAPSSFPSLTAQQQCGDNMMPVDTPSPPADIAIQYLE